QCRSDAAAKLLGVAVEAVREEDHGMEIGAGGNMLFDLRGGFPSRLGIPRQPERFGLEIAAEQSHHHRMRMMPFECQPCRGAESEYRRIAQKAEIGRAHV